MKAKLETFAGPLSEICSRSPAGSGLPLRWTIIANPGAGGFTIGSRWKNHESALKAARTRALQNPPGKDAAPSKTALGEGAALAGTGMVPTGGPGHARELTQKLIEEIAGEEGTFHLIITAGGDGTSLEVLESLFRAPLKVRSRCAVVRLPLGTGNDSADSWYLDKALELFTETSRVEFTRGLVLSTASGKTWPGGRPFLAFNILSVGLDAFVTHMTNKMKGNLPGDSYKLWVDIASLLYDRLYKVGPMDVRGFDEKGREIRSFTEKLLLCAMGVSGGRSYGSHKMILPDERNVCAVKQMSLFRKIALKGLFTHGGHIDKPESMLFTASRVEVSARYPILAQMDGETVGLTKNDFPASIALTEAVIPVLRRA